MEQVVERVDASPAEQEDWPNITVVVPTKDRPEMLRRALVSILQQDYPGSIECLVVFDGTMPVLPDLELPPRRTVRSATNVRTPGLAGNRNTGYLLATGDLLCTCDDDDEWLPGKLTAQVRLLEACPGASMCVTGIVVAHNRREVVRRGPARPLELRDLLRDRHTEAHPSSFMVPRTAVLGPIGLVNEDLPGSYAEDYDWLLRAARQGPVVSVPEPLVRVHWHDSSFFANKWRMIETALTTLLDEFPEFADEPSGLARIEGQLALAHAALGERRAAVRLALRSLRRSRRARQSWAALLVAGGLVSADRVLATARRFGRGL